MAQQGGEPFGSRDIRPALSGAEAQELAEWRRNLATISNASLFPLIDIVEE
jgi:hypothetical protein